MHHENISTQLYDIMKSLRDMTNAIDTVSTKLNDLNGRMETIESHFQVGGNSGHLYGKPSNKFFDPATDDWEEPQSRTLIRNNPYSLPLQQPMDEDASAFDELHDS